MTTPAARPAPTDPRADAGIACPACRGGVVAADRVATFTSRQAADHFCPPIRDAARNRAFRESVEALWQRDHVEVFVCANCTHGFAWPHVAGDQRFYELMHAQAGYPTMRWEYAAFLRTLRDRSTGRHLDVGTGDGSFLMLLPAGWTRCATESTPMLRDALDRKGITTFNDLQDVASREPGSFDSASLFQVIEHIADFRPMLASVRRLLKPGGRLALSVPNGSFKTTQERLTRCADMPPNHVNRWTPRSLKLVLAEAGFADAQVVMQPVRFGNLVQQAGLKTLGAAVNQPRSLSAQFYRVKNQNVRRALFSLTGVGHLVTLLPHLRAVMQPQEFLCISTSA